MASNVVNNASALGGAGNVTPTPKRGTPANLGSLAANTDVVQFTLGQEGEGTNGLDCLTIECVGGTITAALAASIDGGTTWFGVNPRAANGTAPNFTTAGALNSDTASSAANSYDVSGLQAGALFRFGGRSAGTVVVWVLFS